MKDFLYRLTSRKFLIAIGTIIGIAAAAAAGAVSTAEALDAIWKVAVAYVAAEGAADAAARVGTDAAIAKTMEPAPTALTSAPPTTVST